MTDAPKIDTQAPETIWADTDELTWVEADPGEVMRQWEVPYLRRDLADARAAAAAQAMREAAAVIADDEDGDITTYGEHKNTVCAQAVAAEIAMHIRVLPLPDTTALDRLIAERVREAVEAEREACAQIAEVQFDERGRSRAGHHSEMDWTDGYRDATRGAAAAIRARGSKEGQDG